MAYDPFALGGRTVHAQQCRDLTKTAAAHDPKLKARLEMMGARGFVMNWAAHETLPDVEQAVIDINIELDYLQYGEVD